MGAGDGLCLISLYHISKRNARNFGKEAGRGMLRNSGCRTGTFENLFSEVLFHARFQEGGGKDGESHQYGNKRRVTCGTCESVLEYGNEDVKTVKTGANEWEGESFVLIAGRR